MRRLALLVITAALGMNVGCSSSKPEQESAGLTQASGFAQALASLRYRFTSGKSELQRALDAKKQAKSWRMETQMRFHPGNPLVTVSEVSCPDRQRLTGMVGQASYETIRIGGDAYVKNEKGNWDKGPSRADMIPCGDKTGAPAPWAMMSEGRDIGTVLGLLAASNNVEVKRSTLIVLDGEPCQQWEVNLTHPAKQHGPMGTMTYAVCIDYRTHVLRRIVMGTGGMIINYYDWNKPITIEAPRSFGP